MEKFIYSIAFIIVLALFAMLTIANIARSAPTDTTAAPAANTTEKKPLDRRGEAVRALKALQRKLKRQNVAPSVQPSQRELLLESKLKACLNKLDKQDK